MEDTIIPTRARKKKKKKKKEASKRGREEAMVRDLTAGVLRPALWQPLTLVPKVVL